MATNPSSPDTAAGSKRDAKTARSRHAIFEATIQCLVEVGYASTSINRVIETADISKGRLQYHFPSKEDLIADTARYLLDEFMRAISVDTPSEKASLRDRFRMVWDEQMLSPGYSALLEILMIARTDQQLRSRIVEDFVAATDTIDAISQDLSQEQSPAEQLKFKRLMRINRCLARGLVLEAEYGIDSEEQTAIFETWLDLLIPALGTIGGDKQSSNAEKQRKIGKR